MHRLVCAFVVRKPKTSFLTSWSSLVVAKETFVCLFVLSQWKRLDGINYHLNQLSVMCTTNGARRLISIRCQGRGIGNGNIGKSL